MLTHHLGDSYLRDRVSSEFFHRILLKVTDPLIQVDHIDGDGLNNKKENLRLVCNRQNSQNNHRRRNCATTSKFLGVTKARKSWRVRVWKKDTGHICLGSFSTEEEAAKVYDDYMINNFPENLRGTLNFTKNCP
jgi:hypothetical protein